MTYKEAQEIVKKRGRKIVANNTQLIAYLPDNEIHLLFHSTCIAVFYADEVVKLKPSWWRVTEKQRLNEFVLKGIGQIFQRDFVWYYLHSGVQTRVTYGMKINLLTGEPLNV